MNAATIVSMVTALADAVREAPEVVEAVERVFTQLRSGADPSPAVKHLEAVAAAHALGIDATGL